jgi:hypothetical protein
VLDSKQICEQLHEDLDSFSETSQDSDIDVVEHNDPDAKLMMIMMMMMVVVAVGVVTMTKTVIMKIGISGIKMTMIS